MIVFLYIIYYPTQTVLPIGLRKAITIQGFIAIAH